jgi:hypothetical protein
MRAGRSAQGNGGNALSYTSNVCARARAHAHAMGFGTAIDTVASVANADQWLTNPQSTTVAPTVASHLTVATPIGPADSTTNFPWTIAGLIADAIRVQQRAAHRQAPRHHLYTLEEEICRLRSLLIDIFAQQHGWRHSQAWFTPSMLARGGVCYSPWRSGPDWSGEFIDHSYCFRTPDRRAAGFATNPYGLQWTVTHPAIQAFCEHYRLSAAIPRDFPSWWYPGRTTLIVFTPLPEASSHHSRVGVAHHPP